MVKKIIVSSVIPAFSFFLILFLVTPTVFASEKDENHLALFSGVTHHEESAMTSGIEYQRSLPLLNGMLGVGLTYESIFGKDYVAEVYLLNFIVKPWKGLAVNLSPGQHRSKAHESNGHNVSSQTEPLVRYGFAYDFHIAHYSVTPAINIDVSDGETAEVYGIAFGKTF